jgi:Plasmid pRiA4b ORF-3-like protein
MATPPGGRREKTALQLLVSLVDVTPTVWRRLLVPGEVTLSTLHLMIQAAMGWEDYHLHAFEIEGERYGVSDPEEDDEDVIDEASVVLSDLARGQTRFIYEYDFGDFWRHEVVVESVEPVPMILKFAVCVDGQRACPPEDCGGTHGYRGLLEAIGDPSQEAPQDCLDWAGRPFDPDAFELSIINANLQRVR